MWGEHDRPGRAWGLGPNHRNDWEEEQRGKVVVDYGHSSSKVTDYGHGGKSLFILFDGMIIQNSKGRLQLFSIVYKIGY